MSPWGVAYVGGPPWICPAASIIGWSPEVEFFSHEPGDSDQSILLTRLGFGLASASGDEVRLVGYVHPHLLVRRVHQTFDDLQTTESDYEFRIDAGVAVGGGRFWATGGLRIGSKSRGGGMARR